MTVRRGNLFDSPVAAPGKEDFTALLESGGVVVERIVSAEYSDGVWYDAAHDEWVMVCRGGAVLRLADPEETVELVPGDWLFIPRHRRHRVEKTEDQTVWLAIHFKDRE